MRVTLQKNPNEKYVCRKYFWSKKKRQIFDRKKKSNIFDQTFSTRKILIFLLEKCSIIFFDSIFFDQMFSVNYFFDQNIFDKHIFIRIFCKVTRIVSLVF